MWLYKHTFQILPGASYPRPCSHSFSSQVSTDSILAAHNACKDHSNLPPTWPVLSTFIAWLPLLISSSTCSQGSSWSTISLGRLLRLQTPLLCSQESWAHMWTTGGTAQSGLTLRQALPWAGKLASELTHLILIKTPQHGRLLSLLFFKWGMKRQRLRSMPEAMQQQWKENLITEVQLQSPCP